MVSEIGPGQNHQQNLQDHPAVKKGRLGAVAWCIVKEKTIFPGDTQPYSLSGVIIAYRIPLPLTSMTQVLVVWEWGFPFSAGGLSRIIASLAVARSSQSGRDPYFSHS